MTLNLKGLVDKKKLKKIDQILSRYADIFEDNNTKVDVLKAFEFKKPATSIDFNDGDLEKIQSLSYELEEFFFVSNAHAPHSETKHKSQDSIFISRIEYMIEILKYFFEKFGGGFDKFGGIAGLLLKYNPREIALYCSSERMKHLEIIK